ncbi:CoA-binding protein [Candidatus Pacearchaeota archaeon]|nr:CoA-binding protein [Candidatus Pacearchaeota archaeon]
MNLQNFFSPKSIAIIGASRTSGKVGHEIMKNLIEGKYLGQIFPINKEGDEVLGRKIFRSILDVYEKIDLAILAIPAEFVLPVLKQCKKKKISSVLIISSGFKEIGNEKLELEVQNFLRKNEMKAIGVNCLGIYDAYSNLDALFIPRYKLKRPDRGGISFVCQSGAIGAAILDLAAHEGHTFSKFISYGNATDIDESDILKYLENDETTKVICLYVEGIKDGEKFFKTLQKVAKKKPIIALKGGLSEEGSKAVMSHTGSLAGAKEVFYGIFNQTRVIHANSLEEMFEIASLFEFIPNKIGNRIQVVTNGGGFGILSIDSISASKNLSLAELSENTKKNLRAQLPRLINIGNPLDLVGDADPRRYEIALDQIMHDKNVDTVLVIVLYQTPLITKDVIDVIKNFKLKSSKSLIVISTGGDFTRLLSLQLEKDSIPVFQYPENAIKALDKVAGYYNKLS